MGASAHWQSLAFFYAFFVPAIPITHRERRSSAGAAPGSGQTRPWSGRQVSTCTRFLRADFVDMNKLAALSISDSICASHMDLGTLPAIAHVDGVWNSGTWQRQPGAMASCVSRPPSNSVRTRQPHRSPGPRQAVRSERGREGERRGREKESSFGGGGGGAAAEDIEINVENLK